MTVQLEESSLSASEILNWHPLQLATSMCTLSTLLVHLVIHVDAQLIQFPSQEMVVAWQTKLTCTSKKSPPPPAPYPHRKDLKFLGLRDSLRETNLKK